jgi:putative PIN family toxin of toxin-antitoxin system
MDIVIDTNVIISGLFWKGAPSNLLKLCKAGTHANFVSPVIISELNNALSYDKFDLTDEEVADAIGLVLSFSKVVVPLAKISIITTDPSDNMFFECAKESGAEYIVSGDEHLLSQKEYEGIKVLKPVDFLKLKRNG